MRAAAAAHRYTAEGWPAFPPRAPLTSPNPTRHSPPRVPSLPSKGMAWGCDLSYDYVKINAEYTT